MKIIVTIATVDPHHGGPARTVPALCRALVSQGADLELITIAENGRRADQLGLNGFETCVIETRATRYQSRLWRDQFKEALSKALASGPTKPTAQRGAKETV